MAWSGGTSCGVASNGVSTYGRRGMLRLGQSWSGEDWRSNAMQVWTARMARRDVGWRCRFGLAWLSR